MLTKNVSCECKSKISGRKYNSNQKLNMVNVGTRVKNIIYLKKTVWKSKIFSKYYWRLNVISD